MKITGPLKWHGGKADLAEWIIGLMPPRCTTPNNPKPDDDGWLHYVEPFFGGGSVLLANDPEGVSEVVNDLNGRLINFWATLANQQTFAAFQRWADATPFAERCYELAADPEYIHSQDRIDASAAVAFFVRCRQSLSGRMKGFAGITRNRTRRGMNEQVSAWLNAIDGLPEVHARLKRVLIRNQPAIDIIRKEDGPRTLFYLDPPYLHETRVATGEYEHEMSDQQHLELLRSLTEIEGRFLLSGYHSKVYDDTAMNFGWKCHEKSIHNHAAGGKAKRVMTECVWTNY